MIRNCAAHGIENLRRKDLRTASRKPVRSVSVLRMKRPDHDQCRRRWPRSGYSAHSAESDCARPRQGGRSRAHDQ
jgi:hypothetical protein